MIIPLLLIKFIKENLINAFFFLFFYFRSPEGIELIQATAVPTDLSIPVASEFIALEAEEDPLENSSNSNDPHPKRASRRLRTRTDSDPNGSSANGSESQSSTKKQSVPKTSISAKYLSGTYLEKTCSIYSFYSDFKLAYLTTIAKYPIGCKQYVALSDLFKFTIDLILREGVRLSLVNPEDLVNGPNGANKVNGTKPPTNGHVGRGRPKKINKVVQQSLQEIQEEYESELLDGFQKIYSDVVEQYGEAFMIYTQNGPLFTSLDGKSSLDPRDTAPNASGTISTMKILPQMGPLTSYQLAFISPIISAVPHPAIPPTSMLKGFVQVNEMALPAPKWLQYGRSNLSFTPSFDGSNTMVDEESLNSVWYEKYTQKRMVTEKALLELLQQREKELDEEDRKDEEEANKSKTEGVDGKIKNDEDVEMDDADKSESNGNSEKEEETAKPKSPTETVKEGSSDENKVDGETEDNSDKPKPDEEKEQEEPGTAGEEIDFGQAFLWEPSHFIDDDEIEAAENGTELDLISELILQLQDMQRERLAKTDGTDAIIPMIERRLAYKIQNILTRVINDEQITPQDLEIKPDQMLPVLSSAYMGTLPSPDENKYPHQMAIGHAPHVSGSKRYTPVRKRR